MLDSNPYFSAGAGLAGLGVALSIARRGIGLAQIAAQRKLLVTLEVTSKVRSPTAVVGGVDVSMPRRLNSWCSWLSMQRIVGVVG